MRRILSGLLLALLLSYGTPSSAFFDKRQNEAGNFDYYVLSLSWSPSFCEAKGERAPKMQCAGKSYSFVVHGLWPQYDRGYPEYCQIPAPRVPREFVQSMLDIMPSPQLVYRQWDKHGTCSGLTPKAYLENIRKARAAVRIPAEFIELNEVRMVAPGELAAAFLKANSGMPAAALVVDCDRKRLREVRVCLNKDLSFRACAEESKRACRIDRMAMPPVRNSSGAAK